MMSVRRSVAVVILAALFSLVGTLVVFWRLNHLEEAEERRDCERAVAGREDNRAMWVYLLGEARDPEDQPRADAFRIVLDQRLPSLKCQNNDPVPVDPQTKE